MPLVQWILQNLTSTNFISDGGPVYTGGSAITSYVVNSYIPNITPILTGGCALTEYTIYYNQKWTTGSFVYVLSKAIKGYLEVVCIKEVILNANKFGNVTPIYKDTFNYLWNEWDLINLTEAEQYISEYWASLQAVPISTSGSAKTSFLINSDFSIAYVKSKALKGYLEVVSIKCSSLKNNMILYKDTFNYLWNEWDLISLTEAEQYISEYWASLQAVPISTSGSAKTSFLINPNFPIGSFAYVKSKALRGYLEVVSIKYASLKNNKVLYKDTFNYLWNEWDLVGLTEAEQYVSEYWANKKAEEAALLCKITTYPPTKPKVLPRIKPRC